MGQEHFLFRRARAHSTPACALELAEREPAARAVFEMADTVRPGVSELVRSATAEELAQTSVTQPTVFAVDLACARALAAHGVAPRGCCRLLAWRGCRAHLCRSLSPTRRA